MLVSFIYPRDQVTEGYKFTLAYWLPKNAVQKLAQGFQCSNIMTTVGIELTTLRSQGQFPRHFTITLRILDGISR